MKNQLNVLGILYPYAVGHLTSEPAAYLLEVALGRRASRPLVVYDGNRGFANAHFAYRYLGQISTVSSSPKSLQELYTEARNLGLLIDCLRYSNDQCVANIFEIFAAAKHLPPPFSLTDEDRNLCRDIFNEKFGHSNFPHITVSVRSSFGRPQDASHDFRNSSFEKVLPALELCYERFKGEIFIILTGDDFYPTKLPHWVWNYPASRFKSERADVAIIGSTSFHFGTSSGIFFLASVFGRPCSLHNMFPYGSGSVGAEDLLIYKNVYDGLARRTLTLDQAVDAGFLNGAEVLGVKGGRYSILENSSEEICQLMDVSIDKMLGKVNSGQFIESNRLFSSALPELRMNRGMAANILPVWVERNILVRNVA